MAGESMSSDERDLQTLLLLKVGDVSSEIEAAKCVDDVICALHSFAVLLFPVDSSELSGAIDERFRSQVLDSSVQADAERDRWRHAFYHGAAFPAMSRILVYNVASHWLSCFHLTARKQIYDSFFVEGPAVEVVQVLVPTLATSGFDGDFDPNIVFPNVERLVVVCLIENRGVYKMAQDLVEASSSEVYDGVSRLTQLVSSIPDKARRNLSSALSSHMFFKHIIKQLLAVAEERSIELSSRKHASYKYLGDVIFSFIGKMFARILRRGYTASILAWKLFASLMTIDSDDNLLKIWLKDLVTGANVREEVPFVSDGGSFRSNLLSRNSHMWKSMSEKKSNHKHEFYVKNSRRKKSWEYKQNISLSYDILLTLAIPEVLNLVGSCISSDSNCSTSNLIESNPRSLFWFNVMKHLKDSHAVERFTEELLRQLANKDVSDTEAYWTLWTLFKEICNHEIITRLMFAEKFLLWKVFPICCLRWILHFSVFEYPPNSSLKEIHNTQSFLEIVQRLLGTWSKREFVQATPMDQQAYITAAIGFCLERMSKKELESTRDVLNSILQGVSCRLESPIHLVRIMASSVALVFSKIIDPSNPLYLDDTCKESKTIDWSFGLIHHKRREPSTHSNGESSQELSLVTKTNTADSDDKSAQNVKKSGAEREYNFSDLRIIDSAEVIDRNARHGENDQDFNDKGSETSCDTSLQPYDLTDDNTDLNRNFSQLADLVAALRKHDDADGIERALDVAERLIRASPDELQHNAADLCRTLVQIRCSDLTVEGEEESVEGKRQNALVALLATCPFESLDVITRLLYSPNVDTSQRILIIDVMADAAQELADSKTETVKYQNRNLISVSGNQPWFLPSDKGPYGSSRWVEISERESPLNWSRCFERTLPSKPGQIRKGKTRQWSLGTSKAVTNHTEWSRNKFPLYAAAFMLPAMQGFDKKKQGVDFLGRDFIVLGKLIHMLGVCMRCMSLHPEASALAPAFLDLISSREVAHHSEAYVRRSVLYAASCILVALHPSFIASALIEGNKDISRGLEWIRTWAFHVSESDPDMECISMAMKCLQLHSEMALQTSRTLESADHLRAPGIMPSSSTGKDIILPISKDVVFSM